MAEGTLVPRYIAKNKQQKNHTHTDFQKKDLNCICWDVTNTHTHTLISLSLSLFLSLPPPPSLSVYVSHISTLISFVIVAIHSHTFTKYWFTQYIATINVFRLNSMLRIATQAFYLMMDISPKFSDVTINLQNTCTLQYYQFSTLRK